LRDLARTPPVARSMARGGAASNPVASPQARSKPDQTQPRHDQDVASPQTGETQMTADDLFNLLSKLLPSQFEAVLFPCKVPIEHIPAATAPQADRAIATIRYFELQSRLDQLARAVQQVMTGR